MSAKQKISCLCPHCGHLYRNLGAAEYLNKQWRCDQGETECGQLFTAIEDVQDVVVESLELESRSQDDLMQLTAKELQVFMFSSRAPNVFYHRPLTFLFHTISASCERVE